MYRPHSPTFMRLLLVTGTVFCAGYQSSAQTVPAPPDCQPGQMRCISAADRAAAAARARAARTGKPLPPAPVPGGTPDYFGIYPNWANSPIIRKFVDTLPGLGCANKNNLGQYIPVATPVNNALGTPMYPGSDYYEIGLKDYTERMHSDLPAAGVPLRGYYQLNQTDACIGGALGPHYLGPLIVAQKDKPVRVKFTNMLGVGTAGNLFLPVDITEMGAGLGPTTGHSYTQNRAVMHLHGGVTPWISDGTPHQWIVPSGDPTVYQKGASQVNVPDMPNPGSGSMTYFYSNQQSSRLMWIHDHTFGMTRLNVYAGEATGYLLWDQYEEDLISGTNVTGINPSHKQVLPDAGGLHHYGIPLIIQDKTFVPDPASVVAEDPTWNWGPRGNLWFPHVYMTNQNPADPLGVNAMGRWDYGPWFWPPVTNLVHGPIPPAVPGGPVTPGTPNPSLVPEAYMDTPLINGTAYPVLNVDRKAYRFRILNASNDRFYNLQIYYADPAVVGAGAGKEVKMIPANPPTPTSVPPACPAGLTVGYPTLTNPTACYPSTWPTDGRAGGVPDPATAGPSLIQIGTEGGFMPAPAVRDNTPIGYDYNRRSVTVLNVLNNTLLLGPAERADVIVDFSAVPAGSKLILYNDAPAPIPALDPRDDYYTGDPDQSLLTGNATGGAPTTLAGYGPNTRTIMQFQVSSNTGPGVNIPDLQALVTAAYNASQPPPIVPQVAYGSATDTYGKIADTSLTFTPVGAGAPITQPALSKAIHELFELDYGKMNAVLGLELPLTSFLTQTTIPLKYIDPATEIIADSQTQIWKITHNGVDTHPIHFHLFNVQLINRVGWDGQIKPPESNEVGWKETVRMNPLEDVFVAFKPVGPRVPFQVSNSVRPLDVTSPLGTTGQFTGVDANNNPVTVLNAMTNFGWEYVWHCHILGHEESDMMRPVIFTPAADQRAIMVSPVAGTTFTSSSVEFTWTVGSGIPTYLWVGSTPGALDLATYGGGGHSFTANIPTLNNPVYVRLWSVVAGVWMYYDYAYQEQNLAPTPATMLSPVNGTTLPGPSVNFRWSTGTGVSATYLWVGTTLGGLNLATYGGGGHSYTATGLPITGGAVYARLWSVIAGAWSFVDYSYAAANLQATMVTPVPGSVLAGSEVTFTWAAPPGTSTYLWVGTTVGGVDLATYGGGSPHTVNLPTTGATIHVRLWSVVGGAWMSIDYTYTEATSQKAAMTSPVQGSTISGTSATFTWTAGSLVTQYGLWIGTTAGSLDIYANSFAGTTYTATLPTATGGTLYVRLWSLINGAFQYADYTYVH